MPTRSIAILSGKGGVGKTTLTSNLSYILANSLNQKTLAIDANFSMPDLSVQTGIYLYKYSIIDILKNSVSVEKAIVQTPLNFDLIPGSLTLSTLSNFSRIRNILTELIGSYDFILLDSPAGLGREVKSILDCVDEAIIVTNPDLPSIANAMKSLRVCKDFGVKVDCVVVNKIRATKYELSNEKIFDLIDFNKVFFVPYDKNVPKSISLKVPLAKIDPYSPSAIELARISYDLVGLDFTVKSNILTKLLSFFKF
ncbi:MAG: AAA family ATPase [Candidatus Aenigmatarchaeota archaeon]